MRTHLLLRSSLTLGTFATLTTLALGCARPTPRLALAPGEMVMDRCPHDMALVVTNETGYPVRVTAAAPSTPASGASATELRLVASGATETIAPVEMGTFQRIGFTSARPAMPNGQPAPVTGLGARCVRANA